MGGLFGSNQTTSGQSNTNQTTSQNTSGQSNTATSQAYNPYGSSYLTSALQAGIPGALNAVGAANPYYNTASNYFASAAGTPNVSAYFNPLAGAVTSQLQNIFGQQNSQNTGQLTQAAGGVGADRIAVGQAELANQQGLSAGQTLAGLYTPALGAAQQGQQLQYSAGKGMGNLGNSVLSAALQPYQSAASIAASLAPALGGVTAGAGTTNTSAQGYGTTTGTTTGTQNTQSNPSVFSDLLNVGGLFLSRGGRTNPFARGGSVNPFAFDDGGDVPDDIGPAHREFLARHGFETASPDLSPTVTGPELKAMGASAVDPFGLPSAGAKMVAPGFGQRWQDIEAAEPFAASVGSRLSPFNDIPGALVSKGIGTLGRAYRAAPVATSALAGAGALAAGTADAGDAPAGRPDFTVEDRGRLNQLEKEIPLLTKQKQNAINQVGKSRIGAVAQSYDEQIAAKQAEIDRMRSGMQKQQEDYDKAGQPLAMRDPDTVDRIRKGAMMLSAGTGVLGGLSKTPIAKTLIGGLAEGAAGAYAPTMIDMFKPTDTQAYKMAHENVWSPDYFKNVIAPELAYNTVLAGAGHGVGAAGREGVTAARDAIGSLFRRSEPSVALPSAPLSAPATQAGKVWPTNPRDIDMYKDASGKWRQRGTGHFIPKALQPPGGLTANSPSANSIPAEARGGSVNPFAFADGGSPDDSLRYVPSFDEGMAGYYGSIAGGSPPPVDATDIVLGDYGAGKRPSAPAPGTDILPGAGVGSRGIQDPGSGLAYADPGPATPPPRSALASIDPESQGAYNQPPMRGPAANPYAQPSSEASISGLPSPAAGSYRLPGGVEGFLQKAGIISPGVGDYLSGLGMRMRAVAGHGDIDKAAMQLDQAARFHAQQMQLERDKLEQAQRFHDTMTPYQQAEIGRPQPYTDPVTGKTSFIVRDVNGNVHVIDPTKLGDSGASTQPAGAPLYGIDTSKLPPGVDPNTGIDPKTGRNEAYLLSLPEDHRPLLKSLSDYMQDPNKVGYKNKTALRAEMANYDPSYQDNIYPDIYKTERDFEGGGRPAQSIQSFNNTIQHVEQLRKLATAIKNGDNNTVNLLKNQIAAWNGSVPPSSYDGVAGIVGKEVNKAIVPNAGGEREREDIVNGLSKAKSFDQINDLINQYTHLGGAQLRSLKQNFETGTHGKRAGEFDKKLVPESKKYLDQVEGEASGGPKEGERKQFKQGVGVWSAKAGNYVPESQYTAP